MSARHRWLVIQTNGDGRPCAWGLADVESDAAQTALDQWNAHKSAPCYLGEERGAVVTHHVRVAHEQAAPNSKS